MKPSELIVKRAKELKDDRIKDYISMSHIEQHGVNDCIEEIYCFLMAIIEQLDA